MPSATAWKRTDRNVENQQPPQAQCVNTYNSTNVWLCPVALGAACLSSLSPVSPVGLSTPLAPRGLERPKQCCSKGVLLTVHTYILPQLHIHMCSSCYSASLPLPILCTHPQAITTGRVPCLLSKGSAYLVVKLKSLRCIYENNKHVNRIMENHCISLTYHCISLTAPGESFAPKMAAQRCVLQLYPKIF